MSMEEYTIISEKLHNTRHLFKLKTNKSCKGSLPPIRLCCEFSSNIFLKPGMKSELGLAAAKMAELTTNCNFYMFYMINNYPNKPLS